MAEIHYDSSFYFRRGPGWVWAERNPILGPGEPGVESDENDTTLKFKIGNGITPYNDLPYFLDEDDVATFVESLPVLTLNPVTQVFAQLGVLSPVVGVAKLPIHGGTYHILGVAISLGTLPDSGSVTVDVNKNEETIFTTQSNRPSIPSGGGFVDESGTPEVVLLTTGDYLTVDIDSVGTGSPADLVVSVRMLQVS